MFCTNCGVELPANARFCVECGTQADVEAGPVVTSSPVRRNRKQWVALGATLLLAAAVGGAYWYANRLAKLKVDEFIADLEGKVGLTYGDVSANPFARSVTVSEIKITSLEGQPIEGVSVGSITVSGEPGESADPQELDLRVNKLTLDLAQMGPEWAKWMTMGYGTVVVDSRLDYRFSRREGTLDVNRLEIRGQDLVAVGLSLHLGDIEADVASPKDALSRSTMTIRSAELAIEDAVLVERLINSMAEKDGVTPEDYRQQLTTTAEALLGGGTSEIEKDMSAAIVRLINEPRGTLRVTIAPEAPVSLAALKETGDPGRAIKMLNLQVGH